MKWLKRISLIVVSAILLMGIGLGIAAFIYGDKVKAIVVSQLNPYLNSEVSVGDISFEIFRHFPNASLSFENVFAKDSKDFPGAKDTLFYAKHISLVFNVMDIIHNHYEIRKLVFEQGVLHLRIEKNGIDNYHFWKADPASSSKSVNFKLSEVRLKHFFINYQNEATQQSFKSLGDKILVMLEKKEDNLLLSAEFTGIAKEVHLKTQKFEIDQEVTLLAEMEINNDYTRITKSRLEFAKMNFEGSGVIKNLPKGHLVDLSLSGDRISLSKCNTFIPDSLKKSIYDIAGELSISAKINGEYTHQNSLRISSQFQVSDGSCILYKFPLQNIHTKGSLKAFLGSSLEIEDLSINSMQCNIDEQTISSTFSLKNIKDPAVLITAKGNLRLDKLFERYPFSFAEKLEGLVYADLEYRGGTKNWRENVRGQVTFANVRADLSNSKISVSNGNGTLSITPEALVLKEASLALNDDSHFTVNASLPGLKHFLTTRNIVFSADCYSQSVDINKIMGYSQQRGVKSDSSITFNGSRIKIVAQNVAFEDIHAQNLKAEIRVDDTISVKNLEFTSFKGHIKSDMALVTKHDSLHMFVNASIESVEMSNLFSDLHNFGQQRLTSANISGRMSGNIQFKLKLDPKNNADMDQLRAVGDFVIEDGTLLNFQPVQALSKFIKLADLKNIHFEKLSNHFEIMNGRIELPQMEIKSSVLNLTLSGGQSLSNQADYHLKLLLSDLLGRKVKASNPELPPEETEKGKTSLFLTMKGDLSNPKFAYDRKAVAEKIKQDLHEERTNLKNVFKEEWKFLKGDEKTVGPKDKEETEIALETGKKENKPAQKEKKGFFQKLKEDINRNPDTP